MSPSKSRFFAAVIAIGITPAIYWLLLILLDQWVGTQQLYNWISHESRRQLMNHVATTSAWLILSYTPLLLAVLILPKSSRILSALLVCATFLAILGGLLLLGFSTSQSLLFVGTGIIATAIAILVRSRCLTVHRGEQV